MKLLLVVTALSISLFSVAQQPELTTLIEKYNLRSAAISISISTPEADTLLFGFNESMCLTPASVLKLFTTAATLTIFDPNHRFTSELGYNGTISRKGTLKGDIIIRGGGDPALGSPSFTDHYGDFMQSWVNAVKSAGISKLDGRIIMADSFAEGSVINGKWLWEDIGNHWGPGVWSVSLNDNYYSLYFKTGDEGTIPALTGMDPAIPWLNLENRLVASGSSDKGYIYIEPFSGNGWIEGTIPVNKESFVLKGAIPDVPRLLATQFKAALSESGINVKDAETIVKAGGFPGEEIIPISSTSSPTVAQLVTALNMESKNLIAETLFRHYGLKKTGSSDYRESALAMMAFFDSTGISQGDLFMEDGSGVSPQNSVSSSAVTNLLNYASRSSYADLFKSTLPEAGVSGTLKLRFQDPFFEGRLRAKTGGSTRVRGLAGYVKCNSGAELSFAIILNNYSISNSEVNLFMEDLLREVILLY